MTARPCGKQATHVDHIDPRRGRADSALRPTGSTRRWRRIRALVLDRDRHSCQVLVDERGDVVEAPRPSTPPRGPDDPAWLRATCADHNLQRGKSLSDAPPRINHKRPTPGRWDW